MKDCRWIFYLIGYALKAKLFGIAVLFLFLVCLPAVAETGRVTLSSEEGGIAGVEIQIPFGRKYDYKNIRIRKVIDADTLRLADGQRVRLIGIDAPESCSDAGSKRKGKRSKQDAREALRKGKEAAAFVKGLAEGRQCRIEFDAEKQDKYSRLLAYVYIETDAAAADAAEYYYTRIEGRKYLFLNASIVKCGYARPIKIPPNIKHAELFQDLYTDARQQGRGLWK